MSTLGGCRYAKSLRQHIKNPDMRSLIAAQIMQAPRRHTRRDSFIARPSHADSDADDNDTGAGAGAGAGASTTAARRMRRSGHAVKAAGKLGSGHRIPAWLARARAEWVPLVQAVAAGRPRLLARLPRVVGAPRPSRRGSGRSLSFRNSPPLHRPASAHSSHHMAATASSTAHQQAATGSGSGSGGARRTVSFHQGHTRPKSSSGSRTRRQGSGRLTQSRSSRQRDATRPSSSMDVRRPAPPTRPSSSMDVRRPAPGSGQRGRPAPTAGSSPAWAGNEELEV